jgi:hypothetical protein
MKLISLALSTLVLLFAACSTTQSRLAEETRPVTPAVSQDLFIVVNIPVVDDDEGYDPTQGIRFLLGKYAMEAEDADYWYFRSPKPLELLAYDFGRIVNGMRIYGGIAVAKNPASKFPFCAYVDGKDASEKIVIWHLSPAFSAERGVKWALSNDAGAR